MDGCRQDGLAGSSILLHKPGDLSSVQRPTSLTETTDPTKLSSDLHTQAVGMCLRMGVCRHIHTCSTDFLYFSLEVSLGLYKWICKEMPFSSAMVVLWDFRYHLEGHYRAKSAASHV